MSLYDETKKSPIKITISENAKEVIFDLVSVMCDNKYRIGFKKIDGEFKIRTFGQHISNFQIKGYDRTDLEWIADDKNWGKIAEIINSGKCKVFAYKSR